MMVAIDSKMMPGMKFDGDAHNWQTSSSGVITHELQYTSSFVLAAAEHIYLSSDSQNASAMQI